MSERRILKLTIHEFDPTYKFLRVFIEDEYISIKNMVNCNVRFNTESKEYKEKKKNYTEEIEKIVKDEYDSFTKRNTEYKEKVLKADEKVQNRLIETFDDDDITDSSDKQRSLATCDSSLSCTDCNKLDLCSFLSGSCSSYTKGSISSDSYNQATEYYFCANAVSSGSIDVINNSANKNLTLYTWGLTSLHPLCEWKLSTSTNSKTTIKVDRSTNFYEDLYVKVVSNSGTSEYSSKDFASCSTLETTLTIDSASSITIRVKRLSDSSKYSINVANSESSSSSSDDTVTIIITVIIVFFVLCFIAALLSLVVYLRLKDDRREQEFLRILATENEIKSAENRKQEIKCILESMKKGKYGDVKIEYDQTSCVICLCSFAKKNNISIIEECKHVFHSECLASWYEKLPIDRPLVCPHCSTPNTMMSDVSPNNANNV